MADKILIELELDDRGFRVNTKRAGRAVETLSRSFEGASRRLDRIDKGVNGLIPRMRDLFVTISIAKGGFENLTRATLGWQKAILDTNARIERMRFLLEGLSNEASASGRIRQAADDFEYLLNTAETAPFALEAVTDSFVKMRSVGIDPTDGSLRALLDGVAQFGGTDDILKRASIAIQQMGGKGVISMEELRQQLGEAVPTAIALMARSMRLTFAELVDLISQGSVEAQSAINKMFDEFDRSFGGAAERLIGTWAGMVQVLTTRWTKFQIAIGEAGFLDAARDQLSEFLLFFDDSIQQSLGKRIGEALAIGINAMANFLKFVVQNRDAIVSLAKAITALFIISRLNAIIRAVAATMRRWRDATLAAGIAQLTAAQNTKTFIAANQSYIRGLGRAARITDFFKNSLYAIGGPLGILIAALGAAATAWAIFGRNAEDSFDKLERGIYILDEVGLKRLQNEIADLQDQVNKGRENIQKGRGGSRTQGARANENYDLETELFRKRVLLTQAEFEVKERELQQYLTKELQQYKIQTRDIQGEYNQRAVLYQEQLKTGLIDNEEFTELQNDNINKYFEGQLEIYNEGRDNLAAQIENAEEEDKAKLKALISDLDGEILEILEKQSRQVELFNSANELVTADDDGSKGNKLKTYIGNLKGDIAEFNALLRAGSGDAAEFIARLEAGLFGDQGAALLADKERLNALVEQIKLREKLKDQFDAQKKAEREAESARKGLDDITRRLNTDLANSREVLAQGFAAEPSFVARIRSDVEKLLAKLPEAEREASNLLQTLVQSAQAINSVSFAGDLNEETREINNSLLNRREQVSAEFEQEKTRIMETAALHKLTGEDRVRTEAAVNAHIVALTERFKRDMETPIQSLAREWVQATDRIQSAQATWLDDASNKLTEFVTTGKLNFADFAESIINDIIRIRIQAAIAQAILGGGGGGIGGFFGGLLNSFTGGGGGAPAGTDQATLDNLFNSNAFAKGGIMTNLGADNLRSFATGGIATSPQVALFGEGSSPEAFVPLPDGKNIPVKLSGGGQPNVQVNLINESGSPIQPEQRSSRFDGDKLILDVVLAGVNRPGSFRDGMKGALKK